MDLPPQASRVKLHRLTEVFQAHAPTLRGQVLGVVLLITPVITHALPLTGGTRAAVLIIAALAGSLGALIVFGGLAVRALLEPAGPDRSPNAAWDRSYRALTTTGRLPPVDEADPPDSRLDDALLAVPHGRAVWVSLVVIGLVLTAGTLWCLGLLITGHGAETPAEAILLGLPALTLAWAAWRSRAMWGAGPGG